ncbi:hypothetical protein JCGZ_22528 [Jatropha curcas]|uniref:CENP-V/GFA domain-containing protein n=1 Tax=Jatropha curcas TaxID=180498 RepID=A0A067JPC4_JATCU|nr:hypothetical protein JCGZ_22528 [Jatropha curcas]
MVEPEPNRRLPVPVRTGSKPAVQVPKTGFWPCHPPPTYFDNIHFSVPSQKFELLGDSKEYLTTYTFGTHTAKHTFCKCKFCGITSFYISRSSPDRVSVAFRCVDSGILTDVEIKQHDGKNWEKSQNTMVRTGKNRRIRQVPLRVRRQQQKCNCHD